MLILNNNEQSVHYIIIICYNGLDPINFVVGAKCFGSDQFVNYYSNRTIKRKHSTVVKYISNSQLPTICAQQNKNFRFIIAIKMYILFQYKSRIKPRSTLRDLTEYTPPG